ncbi:MAG TPA: cyclic pyranopterin monophosphate synthase MoaC [Thermoproteota archaeon]|nr:cyclic pyranopterin monophosphate synthase MoaC [Thermoproteota archaeon]
MKKSKGNRKGLEMVDITEKADVRREAVAQGQIRLKPGTIAAIKQGKVGKGDVLEVSCVAGVMAAKRTPELIPACHTIPITRVDVDFGIGHASVKAICKVTTVSKTGVEMEALTGVAVALLSVWDMVKELEKDENGQYPTVAIERIRVLRKVKGH